MLRWLVLLLALLNAALFFWARNDAPWAQDDREPQRLQHQVAPETVQVLPDLPASAVAMASALNASGAASGAASGVAPAAASVVASGVASATASGGVSQAASPAPFAPASGGASRSGIGSSLATPAASGAASMALARKALDTDSACAETGLLDDTQLAALRRRLVQAGVAADELVERRQQVPGTWMIYMGRFADADSWQRKADELARMSLKFDRVASPPALAPGISLGSFASAIDAGARLAELSTRGVHSARVVLVKPPAVAHRLQIRAADGGWRRALAAQHFNACPAVGVESL